VFHPAVFASSSSFLSFHFMALTGSVPQIRAHKIHNICPMITYLLHLQKLLGYKKYLQLHSLQHNRSMSYCLFFYPLRLNKKNDVQYICMSLENCQETRKSALLKTRSLSVSERKKGGLSHFCQAALSVSLIS